MKADPNAELRRQLDEQREARAAAVARLKAAAEKAAVGKATPITDKFRLDDRDESAESDDSLPAVVRLQPRVNKARAARTKEVRTLKQTTFAVCQIVQRSVSHPDNNGNGSAPDPA